MAVLEDIRVLPYDEREALRRELHERAERYRAYALEVIGKAKREKGDDE